MKCQECGIRMIPVYNGNKKSWVCACGTTQQDSHHTHANQDQK